MFIEEIKKYIIGLCLLVFLAAACFNLHGSAETNADNRAEGLSKWSKQWLEEVVPYIISNAEKQVFLALPTEAKRGEFIESFWKRRDPDPDTAENEFKLQHFKRVALANKHFGQGGIAGWRTDRGRIFITLGPPSEINRDMNALASTMSSSHGTRETWNYWGLGGNLPYNLEFRFVDKFGSGNYVLEQSLNLQEGQAHNMDISSLHHHFDYMEYLADAARYPMATMEKATGTVDVKVNLDDGTPVLKNKTYYLKGSDSRTLMPLLLEIPYARLSPKRINDNDCYSLLLYARIINEAKQAVLEKSKDINFKHSPSEAEALQNTAYLLRTLLSVAPGTYELEVMLFDNFKGKVGTVNKQITVPSFGSSDLAVSDLVLSRSTGEKETQANGSAADIFKADWEVSLYFEIYNLTIDKNTGLNNFKVQYYFMRDNKMVSRIPSETAAPTKEKDCRIQTSFRLRNFQPGNYILQADVTDNTSGKRIAKRIGFTVEPFVSSRLSGNNTK